VGIKPYPTSLNELTEAATAGHQTLAQEQGVTLDYGPIELEPMVLVDSQQIMQVLNANSSQNARPTRYQG
jgi:signal transduction histidine kinase